MLETDNGERVAMSSRCAELDVQMPLSLGVSKAVLENVIFCHQEDSFWPLSEPGPLKKKFDDIFENARYTRALTELKELKKNQEREVKSDTQTLEFMKADKERSDRVPPHLPPWLIIDYKRLSISVGGDPKETGQNRLAASQNQREPSRNSTSLLHSPGLPTNRCRTQIAKRKSSPYSRNHELSLGGYARIHRNGRRITSHERLVWKAEYRRTGRYA